MDHRVHVKPNRWNSNIDGVTDLIAVFEATLAERWLINYSK